MSKKKICGVIKTDGKPCKRDGILDGMCLIHFINENKKENKKDVYCN